MHGLGDGPSADFFPTGIGFAYVLIAREHGARAVIIADLALTEEAKRAVDSDSKIIFQRCDVTKWSDLQDAVYTSATTLGDVPDIFVASAGVFEPASWQYHH